MWLALSIGFLAYSCHFPTDIGFGTDNGTHTAFFTDTLSLGYSTVLADSAVNGNSNLVLVGNADDPVFGKVNAVAYFQPSFSPVFNLDGSYATDTKGKIIFDTLQFPENAVLDSLTLRLYSNEIGYGNTDKIAKYTVHRLKNIIPADKRYDMSQTQEYEETPLAEFEYSFASMRDLATGRLKVKTINLPLSLARELILTGLEANGDNEAFIKKFKGFAIVPDPANEALYGFTTGYLDITGASSSLIHYWHMPEDTTASLNILNINGPRHSSLKIDRKTSVLSHLSHQNNELKADQTNNRFYLQTGTGLATKIDLSGIRNLGDIKIDKAVLEFRADPGTVNSAFNTPKNFALAETGSNNQQKRNDKNQLLYIQNGVDEIVGSNYSLVDSSNYLNLDITKYLQKQMFKSDLNKQLLLLPTTPISGSTSSILTNDNISRIVFMKPRLLLYYNKK